MRDLMEVKGLNESSEAGFCAALEGVWEHSPWIVARAAALRPFGSRRDLEAAMARIVRDASFEEKLGLLRAHPDLAGKLARAGALTHDSAAEQASLGLDRLGDEEYEAFTTMNAAYRERFGFPFIICVREHTKASIREAFARRLAHSADEELQIALDEVCRIAGYRLRERVEEASFAGVSDEDRS
jgi:OHCU decarboxylase